MSKYSHAREPTPTGGLFIRNKSTVRAYVRVRDLNERIYGAPFPIVSELYILSFFIILMVSYQKSPERTPVATTPYAKTRRSADQTGGVGSFKATLKFGEKKTTAHPTRRKVAMVA